MKKFILAMMIAVCAMPALADEPIITMKHGEWNPSRVGVDMGDESITSVSVMGKRCAVCISPNAVLFQSKEYDDVSGIGVDVVAKLGNKYFNTFRVGVGIVGFNRPLNDGERFNFHVLLEKDLYNFSSSMAVVMSFEHYSNGDKLFNRSNVDKNLPINLFTVGVRF